MPLLSDYDAAVALVVDRRYAAEWPRIRETFGPMVRHLTAFVDGDGRLLHPDLYDQLTLSIPPGWTQGQGAYQHFAAVREIVQYAKDEGLESVLLIEDDAVLVDGGADLIASASSQIRERRLDWDILYYGANHSNARVTDLAPNVMRVVGSLTTHMVGFRHTVYDAVLRLKPAHVIDNLIARFVQPHFNCLSVWPAAAVQKPGHSYLWNMQTDYGDLFTSKGRPS